jgi:RES domain-containing protein
VLRIALGPGYYYRYLTPKWAYLPLSGAGAASGGGRFNRPGVEALYLSAEPETALAEYRQGSSLPKPATLAAYEIELAEVVDLSAGYDPTDWSQAWADWDGDWRWIARVEHKVPPSWRLGDEAISSGARGLLFPSTHCIGGTNLVVFSANLTAGDRLAVHDPDDMLPKDQRSWEPGPS